MDRKICEKLNIIKKYIVKFSKSSFRVSNQDIVLVLSYTKILKSNFKKNNWFNCSSE